jgi:general secretion pathway protein M
VPSNFSAADFKARLEESLRPLKARFMELQPRERTIVVVGLVLVLLTAIYTLGLAPLYKAVNDRNQRITQKQQDLAWMQGVVGKLSTMGAALPNASSRNDSMVVLIANSAGGGGVGTSLTGQTPDGPDAVRVRFEGVQFDALVLWLGALQKDLGIHVKAAEINRTGQSGQVNASLTLSRGG